MESTGAQGTQVSSRDSRGFIVWFTGLPGSGKTTLARALAAQLATHMRVEVLDGDEVRTTVSRDLGYSRQDRDVQVGRLGFIARLLARNDVAVIVAAVSPYEEARERERRCSQEAGVPFLEVYLDAELPLLIEHDTKGNYRRALEGQLLHFTGVTAPYEPPVHPDLRLRTTREPLDAGLRTIHDLLTGRGLITGVGVDLVARP